MPGRLLVTMALAGCILFECSCGSVGEPEPPSLMIPTAVADLSVVERGGDLVISFTPSAVSTDGVRIRRLRAIDLRAGADEPHWESASQAIPVAEPAGAGPVHLSVPAAPWVGREIILRVRAAGRHGRFSQWSNAVRIHVVPPLGTPSVKAEAAAQGVRLSWTPQTDAAVEYRVLKQGPGEQKQAVAATVKAPEYVDNRAVFGQTYRYSVQAFMKSGSTEAQSAVSEPVSITPEDRFPPAVPSGVSASRGISSIELSWDPVPDTDLRGYYVYRAAGDGPLGRLGELLAAPAYSDRAVESGKKYRYAISAIDRTGNESARSSTVEATTP